VNAVSTIMLLMAIETMYPSKRLIHLFVDNARYHHAKLVQAWLARPGCRIKLHFIPAYCPHLDPIERLWGLMHKHVTHNQCHATFADFKAAALTFLREEVPRKWHIYCDHRGREPGYPGPPAQIRTGSFPAYGSYLGCLTAKRSRGQG
jgi:hypothetical protein